MKNLKRITSNLKILLMVNFFIISSISFSANFEDYIEFNPSLYQITSREIQSDENFLKFRLPEKTQQMNIKLIRNNSSYNIYILNFDSMYKLNRFWYNFVEDFSSDFNSFISAIPVLYGKYNGMYENEVMYSWFVGIDKNMYVIMGPDKTIVEDLKYKINKFR